MKCFVKSLLLAGLATFGINSTAQAQNPLCPGVAATGPFSSQMAIPLPGNAGSTILFNWDDIGTTKVNKISAIGADFGGVQNATQIIVAGENVSKTIKAVIYGIAPTPGNPSIPLILEPIQLISNITQVNGLRAEFFSVLGAGLSYSCLRADDGVIPNTVGQQVIVEAGISHLAFNVNAFLPQMLANPIAVSESLAVFPMASIGSVDDYFTSMQATIQSLTSQKVAAEANLAICQSDMQLQVSAAAASSNQSTALLRFALRSAVKCIAESRRGAKTVSTCKRIRNSIRKAGIN